METPLLAAALIVKNEETFLPKCLEALNMLRPVLSEICVYDTGSTDRTVELARASGARVELGYWDDDFSRARNAAIAMCNAKWVLIVDADERIVAAPENLLLRLQERLRVDYVGDSLLRVQCDMIGREGLRTSSFMSPRILRPNRVHYAGRLHENPVARPGAISVRRSDLMADVIKLRHVGYVPEAMVSKGVRNLALAEAAAAAAVNAGRALTENELMNRARSRRLAGDQAGWLSDLRSLRRRPDNTLHRRWAGEQMIAAFAASGQTDEARPLLPILKAEGSQAQMVDWLTSKLLIAEERFDEALGVLRTIDIPVGADGGVNAPIELLSDRFHCAVNVGEAEEAIACGIRLVARYAQFEPFLPLLLRLWGGRPTDVLAQLIVEFGQNNVALVQAALDSLDGPGRDLAAVLAVESRAAAISSGFTGAQEAMAVRSGSSFGLV